MENGVVFPDSHRTRRRDAEFAGSEKRVALDGAAGRALETQRHVALGDEHVVADRDVRGNVVVRGPGNAHRDVAFHDAVPCALVEVIGGYAVSFARLDDVADDVAAEDALAHAAVDRRAVLQFAHHAVDQVLLDQEALSIARDAAVGGVVNLVAIDVKALALAVSRSMHRQRNRARIADANVVDVVVGQQRAGAAGLDPASAGVVDLAAGDAAIAELLGDQALAADTADIEAFERAAPGQFHAHRPVVRVGAESAGFQWSGRRPKFQSADRDVFNRLLPRAGDVQNPFEPRRDHLGAGHVLPRKRPVDDRAGGPVQTPLAGAREPLAGIEDHVLLHAERAGRRLGGRGEQQGMALRVDGGQADRRLVPHVVDADLGRADVERRGDVLRVVEQRGQLLGGGLAIPAAADGRKPTHVEDAPVEKLARRRQPGPIRHPAVDHQGPKVPASLLDAGDCRGPELVAFGAPAGHQGAAVKGRRAAFTGLDRKAVVLPVEHQRAGQKIIARHDDDPMRLAAGGSRGIARSRERRLGRLGRSRVVIPAAGGDHERGRGQEIACRQPAEGQQQGCEKAKSAIRRLGHRGALEGSGFRVRGSGFSFQFSPRARAPAWG